MIEHEVFICDVCGLESKYKMLKCDACGADICSNCGERYKFTVSRWRGDKKEEHLILLDRKKGKNGLGIMIIEKESASIQLCRRCAENFENELKKFGFKKFIKEGEES